MHFSWRLIVCRSNLALVGSEQPPFIIGKAPHVAADAAPPSPATSHAAASIYSQDDVYTRLANLMEWKQRGWLSDTELEAAKALVLQAPRP